MASWWAGELSQEWSGRSGAPQQGWGGARVQSPQAAEQIHGLKGMEGRAGEGPGGREEQGLAWGGGVGLWGASRPIGSGKARPQETRPGQQGPEDKAFDKEDLRPEERREWGPGWEVVCLGARGGGSSPTWLTHTPGEPVRCGRERVLFLPLSSPKLSFLRACLTPRGQAEL